MGKEGGGEDDAVSLFETKEARFRGAYKVFASTVFVGICLIWIYRLTHIPRPEDDERPGRWAWIGMFMAELCFSLYWIFTQSVRLNLVYHHPFKQTLSERLALSLSVRDRSTQGPFIKVQFPALQLFFHFPFLFLYAYIFNCFNLFFSLIFC